MPDQTGQLQLPDRRIPAFRIVIKYFNGIASPKVSRYPWRISDPKHSSTFQVAHWVYDANISFPSESNTISRSRPITRTRKEEAVRSILSTNAVSFQSIRSGPWLTHRLDCRLAVLTVSDHRRHGPSTFVGSLSISRIASNFFFRFCDHCLSFSTLKIGLNAAMSLGVMVPAAAFSLSPCIRTSYRALTRSLWAV